MIIKFIIENKINDCLIILNVRDKKIIKINSNKKAEELNALFNNKNIKEFVDDYIIDCTNKDTTFDSLSIWILKRKINKLKKIKETILAKKPMITTQNNRVKNIEMEIMFLEKQFKYIKKIVFIKTEILL